MLLAELRRGQVVQAAVRTHGVVVPPPGLDHDACLAPGTEPFDVQAFVAQPAVGLSEILCARRVSRA